MFDDLWDEIEPLTDHLNILDTRFAWETNIVSSLINVWGDIAEYHKSHIQDPYILEKFEELYELTEEWKECLNEKSIDKDFYYEHMSRLVKNLNQYNIAFHSISLAEKILLESLVSNVMNRLEKNKTNDNSNSD